jgi:protein involved in polysaccharide export with SLBB domain
VIRLGVLSVLTAALWCGHPTRGGAQPSHNPKPSAVATLGPGDGLRLRIFREPDLSGEYVVDDRGVVVLPKIGEYKVTGVPADSVRGVIRTALKQFLVGESIEITPFRRVAVTGAVLKPGLYPVDPSMSVADALILAGGVALTGKTRVVELRIAGAREGTEVPAETRVWDTGAGGTRQLFVPQKPWAQRNGTLLASLTISSITALGWIVQVTRR